MLNRIELLVQASNENVIYFFFFSFNDFTVAKADESMNGIVVAVAFISKLFSIRMRYGPFAWEMLPHIHIAYYCYLLEVCFLHCCCCCCYCYCVQSASFEMAQCDDEDDDGTGNGGNDICSVSMYFSASPSSASDKMCNDLSVRKI